MWWIFKKEYESESIVIYSYSRESQRLDGSIEYDKRTGDISQFIECAEDKGSEWSKKKAIEKFVSCVAHEDFPNRRKVVIG